MWTVRSHGCLQLRRLERPPDTPVPAAIQPGERCGAGCIPLSRLPGPGEPGCLLPGVQGWGGGRRPLATGRVTPSLQPWLQPLVTLS